MSAVGPERRPVPGLRRPAKTVPRRAPGSLAGPGRPTRARPTATLQRKRDFTTVTALTLSTAAAPALRADALVIGVAKGAEGPVVAPGAEAVDKAYDGKLAAVLETLGAAGAEGEVTKLPAPAGLKAPLVIAVGLGAGPEKDAGVRRRGAAPGRRCRRPRPDRHEEGRLRAAARGRRRRRRGRARAYCSARTPSRVQGRRQAPRARGMPNGKSPLARGRAARRQAARPGVQGGRSSVPPRWSRRLNRARDLINTPPNDLYPEAFAAVAQTAAKEHGIKVQVLDEKALVKGGYGGILGVGAGSTPRPAAGEARRTRTPRRRSTSPSSARASPTTRAASR